MKYQTVPITIDFVTTKNAIEEKKGLKAHETSSSHLENALKWSSY